MLFYFACGIMVHECSLNTKGIKMRNEYLKNLNKIEFALTYACTGKCKHCSQGDHELCSESIDASVAADAVRRVKELYDIRTVMTFGGEPLLRFENVEKIMIAARNANIPKRQVITNGCFSKDPSKIKEVAKGLKACGVNDLLLSVDAFHAETIPIEIVKEFAREAKACAIPMRLQPAWLVSREDENPYNLKTRELTCIFSDMEIPVGEGNIVFPEGNALKYLSEYFKNGAPINPYLEDRFDVRCLSFSPNGDVLQGNVYKNDIIEILNSYTPDQK